MSLLETLYLAWRALGRNRSRAMLTTLGVVIGVASVIAMMSVGAGARQRVAAQLEQMGPNNLIVRAGSSWRSGIRSWGSATRLKMADAEAIRELPGVLEVLPQIDVDVQARFRGTNWATRIRGVTPHNQWPVAIGEFFSEWHLANAENVCVLGQSVVNELFGLTNPVGEVIIIKRLPCRVIGVLIAKGASASGRDLDDVILAPLTTVQRKIRGKTHLNRIVVLTGSREAALEVHEEIRRVMRKRHRLLEDQDDDFRIYNRAELAKASEESAQVFTWLLGSIASVSLVVGGIGIMNMMLVSVTGRTREIGIRMALGARRRDVLLQFLLEAMMLSGIGGVLGIGVGLIASFLLGYFTGLPVSVTLWSVGVAFMFAVIVGMFFGFHPARKAAGFQPVDALRYE